MANYQFVSIFDTIGMKALNATDSNGNYQFAEENIVSSRSVRLVYTFREQALVCQRYSIHLSMPYIDTFIKRTAEKTFLYLDLVFD